MNKIHNYIATFADGSIATRCSNKDFAVAVRVTWTRDDGSQGLNVAFAASRADCLATVGHKIEFAEAVKS